MIRISTRSEGGRTLVDIAGQLTELDLAEVRRARRATTGEVDLTLRDLDGCAPEGIRLVREWLAAGAHLRSATPFLAMVLREPPLPPAPPPTSNP